MSQRDVHQFFDLYQNYRYKDQSNFYNKRRTEFEKARTQAIWFTAGLMGLTVLAAGLAAINGIPSWLKLTFLLTAAILPIFSTAITAYSTLYGFEQQAKLYQDTINTLRQAHLDSPDPSLRPGLSEAEFTDLLDKYVEKVETAFHVEQGQWGQLANNMKVSE